MILTDNILVPSMKTSSDWRNTYALPYGAACFCSYYSFSHDEEACSQQQMILFPLLMQSVTKAPSAYTAMKPPLAVMLPLYRVGG